jgi:PAS domain S-box-containing protein
MPEPHVMTSASDAEAPRILPPLAQVGRSLSAALDTDEVMQRVAEGALRLACAQGAYVERVVSPDGTVEVVAVAGDGGPAVGTRVPYPGSLTEEIIEGGIPRALGQVAEIGGSIAPYLSQSCEGCAVLVVPIISTGEVMGTLVVLRAPHDRPFGSGDAAEARLLADLASVSLRRVRLLEETDRERRSVRALLESTGEGIYGIDTGGCCTFVNPAAARMLGWDGDELLGRNMHRAIHHTRPDGTPYPESECPIEQAFRERRSVVLDSEVLWRRDGTSFPAEYRAHPLLEGQELRGAVVTFVDVTERVRAERERDEVLRRERAAREAAEAAARRMRALQSVTEAALSRLSLDDLLRGVLARVRAALEVDTAAVLLLTRDGRTVCIRAAEGFQDGIEEMRMSVGEGIAGRIVAERRARVVDDVRTAGAMSTLLESGVRSLMGVPLLVDGARATGVLHVGTFAPRHFGADELQLLTLMAERVASAVERARLDEEAEDARAEAEAANRTKSEFLANMSHELRTPINAILGYTELLEMGIAGAVNEAQRGQLARVRTSGQHLLRLINEILDIAKIESGRMSVEHRRANAGEAVLEAVALVEPQAAERGLTVENHCRRADDVGYTGDPDRVRQILVNVLSNAVKFSDPGSTVSVECGTTPTPHAEAELAGEGPWACIRVDDRGIGIAPEDVEAVFQPFVQAEAGYTRTKSGTGLGLTISRRLARLMGGDLTVRSKLHEGSCFTLWLPTEAPAAEAQEDDEHADEGTSRRGFSRVGQALHDRIQEVAEGYVEGMRRDPQVPRAGGLTPLELADHCTSFIADVAQALIILEGSGGRPELMRDGSEIQRLIAERHGQQRARFGWSEEALHREFRILDEVVERTMREAAADDPHVDLDAALAVLARLIRQAEQVSLRGLRLALEAQSPAESASAAERSAGPEPPPDGGPGS